MAGTATRQRRDLAVVVFAVLAVVVGYAVASPGSTLQLAVGAVVGLGALVAVIQHPELGLAAAAGIPLATQAFDLPTLPYVGIALLGALVLRTWPAAPTSAHVASLLIAAFGAVTAVFGILLSTPLGSRTSLLLAIGYATALGIAACLSRISTAWFASVVIGLGVWASMAAWRTPELLSDRTLSVLGENANGIGLFAALGVVATLVLFRQGSAVVKLASLAALVVCVTGVYLSGSRGAAVICLVGAAVLVCAPLLRGRSIASAAAAVVVVAVVGVLSSLLVEWFGDVTGRVALGADRNLTARSESLSYAVEVGMRQPLFGVGLTRLGDVSRVDLTSGVGLRAHNLYAGIFAELGVVGLLPLLAIFVLALVQARRASAAALALVAAVASAGISLEWWGDGGTGPLAMLVLGWAAGRAVPPLIAPVEPEPVALPVEADRRR